MKEILMPEVTNLSFPDCVVFDFQYDGQSQVLKVSVDGAWLDGADYEFIPSGSLLIDKFARVEIRQYEGASDGWHSATQDDTLIALDEVEFAPRVVALRSTKTTGLWTEWRLSSRESEISFSVIKEIPKSRTKEWEIPDQGTVLCVRTVGCARSPRLILRVCASNIGGMRE